MNADDVRHAYLIELRRRGLIYSNTRPADADLQEAEALASVRQLCIEAGAIDAWSRYWDSEKRAMRHMIRYGESARRSLWTTRSDRRRQAIAEAEGNVGTWHPKPLSDDLDQI